MQHELAPQPHGAVLKEVKFSRCQTHKDKRSGGASGQGPSPSMASDATFPVLSPPWTWPNLIDFPEETFQARRDWHKIVTVIKSRDLEQDCSTQHGYHLESKERQKFPTQEKAKAVHHHQTNIMKNVKGTSLQRKKKEQKYE